MRRLWVGVVGALALALCAPTPAGAQIKGQRIAVIGDDARVVAAVKKRLKKRITLVDVGENAKPKDAAELAIEHELHGVITVIVKGSKRRPKAIVSLIEGRSGERMTRYVVRTRRARLARRVGARAWRKLKRQIIRAAAPKPPPEPKPAPEPKPEPKPEPAEESPTPGGEAEPAAGGELSARATAQRPSSRTPWLELSAEGVTFLRMLRYNDDFDQALRDYDLAAPAAALTASWRPVTGGALRFLSVRGEAQLAVGVEGSRTRDGVEYPTSASEWSAGLRAELPIAGWRWMIDASYGEHRFHIDDEEMGTDLVPDVTYRWARGGLGVRVPLTGSVSVDAGGGYRHLLTMGDIAGDAWFPRMTGSGIDAHAGALWQVAGPVALHARADLRRYFFAMNPEVGDPVIAGGAVDQYLAFIAGLSVALR